MCISGERTVSPGAITRSGAGPIGPARNESTLPAFCENSAAQLPDQARATKNSSPVTSLRKIKLGAP